MKVKRFFAADMRQAMKLVRDELGADASIIANRRVAGGVELTRLAEEIPGREGKSLQALAEAVKRYRPLAQETCCASGRRSTAWRRTRRTPQEGFLHWKSASSSDHG